MRFRQREVPVTASSYGTVKISALAEPTRLKNSGYILRSVLA
jgi:hypothetical protein